MMGRIALLFMGFSAAFSASAQTPDWRALGGAEIRAALDGTSLDYGNASQTFRADGGTSYFAGRPSEGRWDVRGDLYCSVWPPSETWVCYEVYEKPGMIRFVGQSGDPTDGAIQTQQ